MTHDVIAVNFGALESARASLSKMVTDFNTNQEEMASGIKPLRDIWQASGSEAAGQYGNSTRRINQHEAEMVQLIHGFSGKVEQARSLQLANEKSIAGTFA